MKTTHSDKANETMAMMGTTGADWFHPAVKWVEEKILCTLRETCPACRGWRYNHDPITFRRTTECERCKYSTGRTGTCLVTKERVMMVGYIQWPAGVSFESRFGYGGSSAHQCELCSKGINKSGRVPLASVKNGKALGMWVGEDCARKFAKVAKLKPDAEANPKKREVILKDNA